MIQRAYEEGEEELLEEENGEHDITQTLGVEKDEKTYLLDEQLRFRSEIRRNGQKVLAWRDLSGDEDDLYEFVCDTAIPATEVSAFEVAAVQCQYERKYRKPHNTATAAELERFNFSAQPIPSASPISSPISKKIPDPSFPLRVQAELDDTSAKMSNLVLNSQKTIAPAARAIPEGALEVLSTMKAELHMFDFASQTFILQDAEVTATVSDLGSWRYWLQISSDEKNWLGSDVTEDINPVFNFEYTSFIFNHYTDDGSAYSWLLKFKDQPAIEQFQMGLMQALWEHLNQTKWLKSKDDDRQYVLDAFQDIEMNDADDNEEEEEVEPEELDDGLRSEHYDSDESGDVDIDADDGNVNSQLAVGYKHDRSFVVRGSKIGVFKHTPNNNLEFSTNISKVETPGGKLFSPKKVMLHAEDSNMILQNANEPNSLYRMDLEYGKIVEEWKIHDDIPVTNFAPEKVSYFPRRMITTEY